MSDTLYGVFPFIVPTLLALDWIAGRTAKNIGQPTVRHPPEKSLRIHKFTYPVAALQAMPKAHLSAFLLLGHFLNEVNWLQKLLLYGAQDKSGNEPEQHARLALSLMVSKVFATKIHEGWLKLNAGELGATVAALTLSAKMKDVRAELEKRLQKDSILHRLRNSQGAHYPSSLSLDGLPSISQSDVALYLTPHAGDTISVIAELSAAAETNAITELPHLAESLDLLLKEVVNVSGLYSNFLHASLVALIDLSLKIAPTDEIIGNEDAMSLADVRLRFFVTPPGVPLGA